MTRVDLLRGRLTAFLKALERGQEDVIIMGTQPIARVYRSKYEPQYWVNFFDAQGYAVSHADITGRGATATALTDHVLLLAATQLPALFGETY